MHQAQSLLAWTAALAFLGIVLVPAGPAVASGAEPVTTFAGPGEQG